MITGVIRLIWVAYITLVKIMKVVLLLYDPVIYSMA